MNWALMVSMPEGWIKSWRQQPGTPVYTEDFDAEGVRRALSEAKKERTQSDNFSLSEPNC